MAKKARQRISYVLDLPNSSPGGHRLGVNGLAVDRDRSILYSGGRDGVVCAWDLDLDLGRGSHSAVIDSPTPPKPKSSTRFRAQTQAHTHWINDIVLAQNHGALVSASSDLTVKVWRPHGSDNGEPVTIGQHADYVKCLATPDQNTNWVMSGGLDRKICQWDLNGGGKTLEIDVSGEEVVEKGSVYALSVNHHILASGGPESTARLWDPRSGKRITKFVGHTDNVRAILLNEAGDTVITASSDQTVKVWSVTAGRCTHTLTMHNDSVWALFSDDPDLGVFYSSDRSGLVVKTDVRGTHGDLDYGLSLAIAQENDGVSKVIACGSHLWTATSRSSINRWRDIDTEENATFRESLVRHRASISSATGKDAPGFEPLPLAVPDEGSAKKDIPLKSILRISNTAPPPFLASQDADASGQTSPGWKGPEVTPEASAHPVEPAHHLPEETIEGQFGLVKHKLLNDRRRVLTLDTAGDVLLWDLIKCQPIRSFGKRHLEDVEPLVNKLEAVAPWCSIDISSGNLTVVLEPYNCFDAEAYADELALDEATDIREDQRINLGKWILRYLFASLIEEEIKRDVAYRAKLNEAVERRIAASRANPLRLTILPQAGPNGFEGLESPTTPRTGGVRNPYPPMSPGIAIGLATPATEVPVTPGSPLGPRVTQTGQPMPDREDYFSNAIHSNGTALGSKTAPIPAEALAEDKAAKTVSEGAEEKDKDKEKEKDKEKDSGKSPSTPFGKKFRMGMSFGTKKLGRSASVAAVEKPVVVEDSKAESESSSSHEKEVDDSFLGVIQKIHNEYDKQLGEQPEKLVETRLTPSLPNDTPVLNIPPATKVFIQEETSGGSAEVYRGTVATVGLDVDVIERCAPMWLGDVLLTNEVPHKDPAKISFLLCPYDDESLPHISAIEGNNRLNANRMLRIRKILAYVAERIDPSFDPENADPHALKPEDYLELYCNDQLLPATMSLATLRAHVWKSGNDVVLKYKANGRKEIPLEPLEPPVGLTSGEHIDAAPVAAPSAQPANIAAAA